FQWINKHMNAGTGPVKDAAFKPIPGKELRVFAEEKDFPADAINTKIDESFVPRANVELPKEGAYVAWKSELMQQLRHCSFRAFPDRIPEAVKVRTPANAKMATLVTEPGIEVRLSNLTAGKDNGKTGTVIVLAADEDANQVPVWASAFLG